ncbi:hypothetical protein Pcinc_021768 [Petrolisthes cinctipes]|uniref:Uncharacterized protein n=1 Tax=Petrolisthes cinctipes TaxID=88211 RepID=A0AAE1FGN1_PETCI|nr:hypothetical protein Pcinc_021768 [Petrolisthes cinctipes]
MPQMCPFPQPQHQFPAPFPYFPCLLDGHHATIYPEQPPQPPQMYHHSPSLHHPDMTSVNNEHFHSPRFSMQQYRDTCIPPDGVHHSGPCIKHPGHDTREGPTPPLPPHQATRPMGPSPIYPHLHDHNFPPHFMHPLPHPSSSYHISFPPPPMHHPSPSHVMSPGPFAFSPAHSPTGQPSPLPHQCFSSPRCSGPRPSLIPHCSGSSPHPGIHSHRHKLSHRHLSPMTRHSSPSRHPSPTPQHLSPSPRHPSPSPRHPSPSARHHSPMPRHPSPLSRHPSPSPRHPSLSPRHPSPSSRHPSPSPRHPSPTSSPRYNNHHKHHSHYSPYQRSITAGSHVSFSRALRPPPLVLARQRLSSVELPDVLTPDTPQLSLTHHTFPINLNVK